MKRKKRKEKEKLGGGVKHKENYTTITQIPFLFLPAQAVVFATRFLAAFVAPSKGLGLLGNVTNKND